MLGLLITKAATGKYECKDDNDRDLICMQSQFQRNLNILAISFDRDQICLQCRKLSWSKVTTSMIFGRMSRKKFSIFAKIFGPYRMRLQAYLVPFEIAIAYIRGPDRYHLCTHI